MQAGTLTQIVSRSGPILAIGVLSRRLVVLAASLLLVALIVGVARVDAGWDRGAPLGLLGLEACLGVLFQQQVVSGR